MNKFDGTECSPSALSQSMQPSENYVHTTYQHKLLYYSNGTITIQEYATVLSALMAISGFFLTYSLIMSHNPYIALHFRTGSSLFSLLDANPVRPVAFCRHITSRTAQVFMPPHN